MLATPPVFDISHSLVVPLDAFCHRMSIVPSPLKSPAAITFHPCIEDVPGLLPTPPAADISHSLVAPVDALSSKTTSKSAPAPPSTAALFATP